jgi:transcriptional regulator with XRE-family HTH domain
MMTPARKEVDTSTYAGRFAVRLKTLRTKAGLTPEEAADAIGVTATAIYHWESGLKIPAVPKFPVIAKAYNLKSVRFLLPNN